MLDAPAEVLHERKREGTIEYLERMRQDHLALQGVVDRFVRVDATQDAEAVTRDVVAAITNLLEERTGARRELRTGDV